ncbi:MAG TPA: TIR domain-containing protein [Steroidobacteraceae bacterium]|jgi:TolB-like protein/cytochrome c-type biogenesis protein CcmH/NrfG
MSGLGDGPSSGGSQRAVFLSYASEDAEAAQRICAALRGAGIEVWFDRSELRGGDAWDVAIRRQIKSCALFVPIISANTRSRVEGYFRLEWKLAVDRSHLIAAERAFLLPIVIDATLESDALVPDRFRELQWTRLPAGQTTPEFVARVTRLLHQDEPAAPAPDRIPAAQSPVAHRASAPARRKAALLLGAAALLIAAGIFAVEKFSASRRAADAGTDKSIAVLPFVDMSEKHDQEYFSDGLAEELLDLLAKVPGLTVIARTSSFSFKGKSEDIPTIARKLNVANVLEGSVRKSGRRLRITTQLIRADTGVHIWSETYDRDEDDVFKVQEDIARAVVGKLKLALLGDVPVSAARTSNPEVYNLFLQGRYSVAFDTPEELEKSIECYRKAIAIDPGYAPAWAGMSYAIFRQVANGDVPIPTARAQAMAAARKAAELDPTLPEAYNMIGSLKMVDFDWSGAREAIDHALQLDPNNLSALFSSAHLTMTVGKVDNTLTQFRDVLERDPLNLLYRRYVARVLYYAGRLSEAEAMIRQVLAISPSFPAAHYELGRILLARGQIPAAVAEFETEKSGWRPFGLPLGYHAQQRDAEAKAALEDLVKNYSAGAEFQVAETYAVFGDADKAFHWFDQAVEQRDPGLQWLRGDPMTKGVVSDPRYPALLQRLKLPP